MRTSLLNVLRLAVVACFLGGMQPAFANYGGSGGQQQEAREDDYYYGGCYSNACVGRCGPGCSTYFGTTTTYACQQHDNCIRDNKCAGYSGASAHYRCLTGSRGLGRAAGSLIRYHWDNAVSYVKDTWQSTWARVGS